MNRLKLLHCADLHLDAPFTTLAARPDGPETRRQEIKAAFGRIVGLAAEENADLLLVCGDLYEHDYVRNSTIRYICDQLKTIPGTQVIMIPGNHDPLSANSYYAGFDWPDNVHILSERDPFFLTGDGSVCIYGLIPDASSIDPSRINILMAHGTVDMNFSRSAYNHLSSSRLEGMGFDYIAVGHFHGRLPGIGKKGIVYNPGSPEPLGFDEEGDHGIYSVEIEKEGVTSRISAEFRPIGLRKYTNLEIPVQGCATTEQAAEKLTEAISNTLDLYNITIKGTTSEGFRINTETLAAMLSDKAFFVRIADITRPDYDFGLISREQGLKGAFVREMLQRVDGASGEDERQMILQALYYGMEAIEQGRVSI